jgi:1-phosphatidylinositol phosphodiesterase
MSHLSDSTPLSALSIPGTHNSPCYYKALPSVRCQAVSPLLQLQNGIRFFDIRLQPESPTSSNLVLVHAVFPISLTGGKTFTSLLSKIYAFLDANPSETLIMSVKREGIGNMTDQQVARILHDHYTSSSQHAHHWYTTPSIPTLGQARGKIVLMRRLALDDSMQQLHTGAGWALDAECWADNTPCDYHGDVCVQDFYEVESSSNIEKKIAYCTQQLQKAASVVASLPGVTCDAQNPTPPQPFFVNFLTASNFFRREVWPERVAGLVGPRVLGWLCEMHGRLPGGEEHGIGDEKGRASVEEKEKEKQVVGDAGCGVVVMDWVGLRDDWDLVRVVVAWNAKLMMREIELVGEQGMG